MSVEIKSETIEKTQKLLGKYISKPSLTEKLLRKPPFRFLHDIVTAVIRDTGFLNGLYTDAELVSGNVKERDAKVAYLTKLIDAISTVTKIELSVKPSKVIAGLEPTETNKLLQAIGTALDKKLDSTSYVKDLKSDKKNKPNLTSTEKSKPKKTSKSSSRPEENVKESTRSKRKEEPEVAEKSKVEKNSTRKKKESTPKEEKHAKSVRKTEQADIKKSRKVSEVKQGGELVRESTAVETDLTSSPKEAVPQSNEATIQQQESPSSFRNRKTDEAKDEQISAENIPMQETLVPENSTFIEDDVSEGVTKKFNNRNDRPKSARPHSSDIKKEKREKPPVAFEDTKPSAVSKNEVAPTRPMSSLRPPSVRPSSARPGAPRLRSDSALPLQESIPLGKINVIVENFSSKEVDEEETVVIHSEVDSNPEAQPVTEILDIPADKGHLVEQILEQIHEDDVVEHAKSKTGMNWEQEVFRNRDSTGREINQLRSSIQALTRVANPLGKLMNYLHEDVEAMHSELNTWMNMKKQMWIEIKKQEGINEEASTPLRVHLHELEENIRKQEEEIRSVRSNILRNDLRIKELLTK